MTHPYVPLLDTLHDFGLRAVWVSDLGHDALTLREHGIILLDADLTAETLRLVVDRVRARAQAA